MIVTSNGSREHGNKHLESRREVFG